MTKLNIQWDCLDDKFQYAAMDKDGAVWVYEERPHLIDEVGQWQVLSSNKGYFYVLTSRFSKGFNPENVVWYESLTKRPEGETND